MDTSLLVFPDDLAEEGLDRVCAAAGERARVGGLTLAAAYHAARDVMPNRPARRIVHTAPGAGGFIPDGGRYETIAPLLCGPAAAGRDLLGELRAAAHARDLRVHAWAVLLHADGLGERHPEHVERSAFGDPLATQLCPAAPAASAYVRGVAGDLGARGIDALLAEALHFHGFEHGHHHERVTLPLSADHRVLLGLCFCAHCRARAQRAGVDGERVAAYVRDAIDRALNDPGEPDGAGAEPDHDALATLCDGEVGAYLDVRAATVTSLAAEAAEAAAEGGARLFLLDPSGSVKGYADGRPQGAPVAQTGWRFGVDPEALAAAGVVVEPIAYAADPARVAEDLAAYRALAGPEQPLAAVMRPSWPDCADAQNLRAKLAAARATGVERVDFYHYALMPPAALERIAAALP